MQCRRCNQFFGDEFNVCPHCGEIVTLPSKATKNNKKRNQILSIALSLFITAIPIGIRTGIREHREQQNKQLNSIQNIDVNALKGIIDSVSKDTNIDGTLTGDVYENHFFGIGCKLPDWTFLSSEELIELRKQTKSITSDVENSFFVCSAFRSDRLADVNILVSDNTLGENPDEKYGINQIANQINNNKNVISCECIERNIGGENKYILKIVMKKEDTEFYIYQFLYFRKHKYAIVTLTTLDDSETENIFRMFYKTDIN